MPDAPGHLKQISLGLPALAVLPAMQADGQQRLPTYNTCTVLCIALCGDDECAEIIDLSRAYHWVVEEAGWRSLPLAFRRG